MRAFLLGLTVAAALASAPAIADAIRQTVGEFEDRFRQLDVDLPTPNVYRTASGAPGPQYWQQRVDYDIEVVLDEDERRLTGSETVTYTNNSPDTLRYVWFQLDQNRFRDDSMSRMSETAESAGGRHAVIEDGGVDVLTYAALRRHQAFQDQEYGFELSLVADGRGRELDHVINDTMLRIDLAEPLEPGETSVIRIDWAHNLIDQVNVSGRSGYEYFYDTDTEIFFAAQWFPRAAAYTDYSGWANQQFLGRGEFTLEFGDYDVEITVPSDHIVAATGELQNPNAVLSAEQRARLREARDADEPVFIVTPEEAFENEMYGVTDTRTWRFSAENVRDFAWASSRKFIWDAMGVEQDGEGEAPDFVMAMSFYPNEAEPLWSRYSTHAVAHTMEVYSRFSFPYPYPNAISVNTWARGGMEYPMITFNGYRPELDVETNRRSYSRQTKYGLIGVIIHEIGHIYFPMTVNSDERQWTWMDEGLNTFLEYVAETEWEEDFPAWNRGEFVSVLDYIPFYMVSEDQVPIMTQSDAILQFGPNAYSKPAAALTILRETVMGRELFDFAFREYAQRWRFRRPTPADFFRTMEDASGVDLDWFWRGWFYSTDHVDIAIADVREYQISNPDPDVEYAERRTLDEDVHPEALTYARNREEGRETYVERNPGLSDFYNDNDAFTVSNADRNAFAAAMAGEGAAGLANWERTALERAVEAGEYVYFVDFANEGGLVMPLPLEITFEDGETEFRMLPAEIWRRNHREVTRLFIEPRRIVSIELDPRREIADADLSDNHFPRQITRSRLEVYRETSTERNLMRDMLVDLRGEEADASGAAPLTPVEDGAPADVADTDDADEAEDEAGEEAEVEAGRLEEAGDDAPDAPGPPDDE